MTRKILYLLVALFTLPTAGCAAIPIIAKVATAVTDAGVVLDMIQQAVNSWARYRDDRELIARADTLILNARTALRSATAATNGARNLSQEEYEAAFSDFSDAYAELHSFLKETGILKGSKLGLGNGEECEIPEPLALSMKID